MIPRPLTMSANYLAIVRGLRELHQLAIAGRQDSPEADAVRDATDASWEALTDAEKKRITGLSEDLYSITDPQKAAAREMNPQAQSRLVDVYQARQRGEWDRVLELLRRWAAHIDPPFLSYLRGSTWLDAGDPATASLFFEHAWGLQPDNGNYLGTHLYTLQRCAPVEAQRLSETILQDPEKYPPVAVAQASNIVFGSAQRLPEGEASQHFRRLIPLLKSTLDRIEKGDEGGVDGSTYSITCALLGFCHEFLGENQAALGHYSQGLAADPTNDSLLVARGILLYGESPRAVTDFELAAQHKPPVIWPYFFLAHHYLVTGLFDQCRSLCERASEMSGSDAVKSELAEWLAISQSELGYPVETVRNSFDTALRLDPTNERARRNLAAFEAATRPQPVRVYETRSKSAIRASGLSERRLQLPALRPAA
jgi:tetratricopeptide (TPR) repeat protein